jgi:hypothetical protein
VSLEEVDELMKVLLTNNVTPAWVKSKLGHGDATTQYLRETSTASFETIRMM